MSIDPRERRQTIIRMSPQNKSEVMRAHLNRRLQIERALSSEQAALLNDFIEFSSPESYTPPMTEEHRRCFHDLMDRAFEHFTREEIFEVLTLHGPTFG